MEHGRVEYGLRKMAAVNQNCANENISQIAGGFAILMAAEYREVCDNSNVKLIKKCVLRNSRLMVDQKQSCRQFSCLEDD